MKKVNVLIILALVFISGVMIFLMFQGVHLKPRRMVKWSSVDSLEQGTSKIVNFFFPILKEWDVVVLKGDSPSTPEIFEVFKERSQKISPDTQLELNKPANSINKFEIFVVSSLPPESQTQCDQGDMKACTLIKSFREFSREPRDSSKIWISLYRLGHNQALFIVKSP